MLSFGLAGAFAAVFPDDFSVAFGFEWVCLDVGAARGCGNGWFSFMRSLKWCKYCNCSKKYMMGYCICLCLDIGFSLPPATRVRMAGCEGKNAQETLPCP